MMRFVSLFFISIAFLMANAHPHNCREFTEMKRKLDLIYDKLFTPDEKDCIYRFKLTSTAANFHDAREMCKELGGDLLHVNFGEAGHRYHQEIRNLCPMDGTSLWIGYTDREVEGVWKLVNGQDYNGHDPTGVYMWGEANPDNWTQVNPQGEDCGVIRGSPGDINDVFCGQLWRGLCEIKKCY